MKIKTEGKGILNGSAARERAGRLKKIKLNHQKQQSMHTGNTVLKRAECEFSELERICSDMEC